MHVQSWITITILVNLIALIFQIGAYAAPMWIWRQNNAEYEGTGLWYTVSSPGVTILTFSDENAWLVVKVLQSVGLAGVLTLAVFLVVYKIGHSYKWGSLETVNLVAFILCITTILILLASAVVYPAYFWTVFQLVNNNEKTSLPWSPLMSFLACLVLMLVCYFIRNKCRVDIITSLPMSGADDLDLQPRVQNGLANRYYNQTPYIDDKTRYIDDRPREYIRGYGEQEHRRNGSYKNYEQRTTYVNRAYQTEPDIVDPYSKPPPRELRDNRDRDAPHTAYYTGNGFSYLKEEVNRPERDDRFNRPERDDRFNRPERDDRFNRPERDDRFNRPERDDGFGRTERDDRFSRFEREDNLNRLNREERYGGRQSAYVEYTGPRGQNDILYSSRSSSRPLPGASRDVPASSNLYIYRPHHY